MGVFFVPSFPSIGAMRSGVAVLSASYQGKCPVSVQSGRGIDEPFR